MTYLVAPDRAGSRKAILTLVLAGVFAASGCTDTNSHLQQARDTLARTLPAPYFEDLVTESVSVEGDRLVLLVRSPTGDADKTRQVPGFDALRQSEQQQMASLCELPAIEPLRGTDAVLVRRFVDRHDTLFFETELPVSECPAPPA